MGREATRGAMNPREVGLETYELSRAIAMTPEQALHTALDAAVNAAYLDFKVSVRDGLLGYAESIDANEDDDLNTDGPAALIAYAIELDETLPPERRKEAV